MKKITKNKNSLSGFFISDIEKKRKNISNAVISRQTEEKCAQAKKLIILLENRLRVLSAIKNDPKVTEICRQHRQRIAALQAVL